MDRDRDIPLLVFANFVSEVTADLSARSVMLQGVVQSPRKIWLTRPGDVLVTPVALSDAFRSYACGLLGIGPESVDIVTVPTDPEVPLVDAVRRAGLVGRLRELVADRPGIELLPSTLDRAAAAFAAELGVPVHPYGPGGLGESGLEVSGRLNTKTGFREIADKLGVRIPDGRSCPHASRLADTVRELLGEHGRVVVKPARSAGGHGLRFLTRTDLPQLAADMAALHVAAGKPPEGWVVEQGMDFTRAVSVQLVVEPTGPRAVFAGEMRTAEGCFDGYLSPIPDVPDSLLRELEQMGLAFGGHLAEYGYLGPFDIDAGITADGTLYATESNVRRTATSTPGAMAERLASRSRTGAPAWLIGKRAAAGHRGFAQTLALLRKAGLAYDPARGEGVVLYADAPAGCGDWRYAIVGADRRTLEDREAQLAAVLGTE